MEITTTSQDLLITLFSENDLDKMRELNPVCPKIFTSRDFWIQKLKHNLPEEISESEINLIFSKPSYIDPDMSLMNRYIRALAYSNVVIKGSEKFLDIEFCLLYVIKIENVQLFEYFWNLDENFNRELILEHICRCNKKAIYDRITRVNFLDPLLWAVLRGWEYKGTDPYYLEITQFFSNFLVFAKSDSFPEYINPKIITDFDFCVRNYQSILYFTFLADIPKLTNWILKKYTCSHHVYSAIQIRKAQKITQYINSNDKLIWEIVEADSLDALLTPEFTIYSNNTRDELYLKLVPYLSSTSKIYETVYTALEKTFNDSDHQRLNYYFRSYRSMLAAHISDLKSFKRLVDLYAPLGGSRENDVFMYFVQNKKFEKASILLEKLLKNKIL